MAGLPKLKKCGKIQNVVSSSDFEIFSPKMHAPTASPPLNFHRLKVAAGRASSLLCILVKDQTHQHVPSDDIFQLHDLANAASLNNYTREPKFSPLHGQRKKYL